MNNRTTLYIGLLVLVLANLAVFMYFIQPQSVAMSALDTEIEQARTESTELTNSITVLKSLASEVPSGVAERQKLLMQVPPSVDQDGLMDDLSGLSARRGIELKNIGFSLGKTDEKTNIGVITMSTGFEGTYQDLLGILSDLEKNSRMIRVRNIAVQVHDTTREKSAKLSFTLTLESYYQE